MRRFLQLLFGGSLNLRSVVSLRARGLGIPRFSAVAPVIRKRGLQPIDLSVQPAALGPPLFGCGFELFLNLRFLLLGVFELGFVLRPELFVDLFTQGLVIHRRGL